MTISRHQLGTALVTGASGGIGAVYADRLARRGHDLVLVARNEDRLQQVAGRLGAQTGRRIEVLVADLAERDQLRALERRISEDPAIDMLVNNAGFNIASPISQSDPDGLEAMIHLNVIALARLSRAAAPAFVERGGGTIVNIASVVALAPHVLNGAYSGTKAFVVNFSQALGRELESQGLRVQAVLPGATRTDFWDVSGLPVTALPSEIVMSAEDLVDSALAGLDQGELITIPALEDQASWERFEGARQALEPHLSRSVPASRYRRATSVQA